MKPTRPRSKPIARLALAALACSATLALAAPADISNTPLATTTSSVRSNVMLILDNSTSMVDDFMPDNVAGSGLCFGYAPVNTIFFDPNVTYKLPLRSDGSQMATPSWPNAWTDGYASSLSNFNVNTAPQWSNASSNSTTRTFYYTVLDSSAAQVTCPDGNRYRLSRVTASSSWTAAQRTNYLIWYTYYRTRLLTMRGAVGRAMAGIDASRFRIGLSAISDPATADNSFFLSIRNYDAITPVLQKQEFYSRLYSISNANRVVSGTPLRPALEKIGKYYANRALNGNALPSGQDPVQYACQRNFAILTTDGYWTRDSESGYRSSYSPTRLNGSTAIGNVDDSTNNTPRPMLDDGTTQGSNWVTGGSGVANTLADVARFFSATDLRTSALGNCTGAVSGQDVCGTAENPDPYAVQNMTTFTLGLGVGGQLSYQADYETATSGDFSAIKQGTRAWPNPRPTISDGSVTAADEAARIDDLWHAGVNGGGRYYSAKNPDDVVVGLTNTLLKIDSVSGTGAAAATSTLQPVQGDNFVFLGMYTTQVWEGNIRALTIDTTTGAPSATPLWEARTTLKNQANRNIYFFNSSATNKLTSFTFANLSAAGKGALFQNVCSMASPLSQCPSLTGTALSNANSGTNMVEYLRGRATHENVATNGDNNARVYRGRDTPLGDMINAAPVYVRKPPFRYADAGYNTFASNNASRTGVVYAAANDGMLHAFDASTGDELWAYVPTAAMANMYRLADSNYATMHRFFVDGTPVVADVFDGTNWRTILVGGLGGGGRAYYALDVTDPANPIALWEFSSADDPDLGLAYGNPVIAKNKAGTWVVAFTSGYNNVSPGSGGGFLFVRNVVTGAALAKIPTGVGNTTTPSNLGRISPWVNSETNNTALRFYAGDMLGNLWRIDFDDNIAPSGNEAMLLARTEGPTGVAQPITIRPQLTELKNNGNAKVITVATGRLLGVTDVGDTTVQSIYVFKDTLSSSGLGVLRSNSNMVAQTMAVNGNTRAIPSLNAIDWSSQSGWYVDLGLSAGERVNVDTIQVGNLLAVASNIPTSSVCTPGGSSWLYFFDITNGNLSDAFYGSAMTAGMNVVKLGTGLKIIRWNIRGEPDVQSPGTGVGTPIGTLRRISWRELVY